MPIDATARAFIEANIDHYREVTVAVGEFEKEVEAALRSIWTEFQHRLDEIGIPREYPTFRKNMLDGASDLRLETRRNVEIQIILSLQCADEDHKLYARFSANPGIRVKDPQLRQCLDTYVKTYVEKHWSRVFVHEFVDDVTYITANMDLGRKSEMIDLLHKSFEALLDCLSESPELRQSRNISGTMDRRPLG